MFCIEMEGYKNGTRLSFKDIFSKKISGYRKVCTDEVGQSVQILLTESDDSECEIISHNGFNINNKTLSEPDTKPVISDEVRLLI